MDNAAANYALGEPDGVFTYTATAGQPGFPTSVADVPLPRFPSNGVVPTRSLYIRPGQSAYLSRYFPTSILNGYPEKFLNPYSQQWTLSLAQRLPSGWLLNLDYVGTHTRRINRPLDVDGPAAFIRTAQNQSRSAQAANCSRPYWIYWFAQKGLTCSASSGTLQAPYSVIQTDVPNGFLHYNALDMNLTHAFSSNFQLMASYTWSHTLDNVDPDTTSQSPNDTNLTGREEYGPAIFDQRHRAVLSGEYRGPWRIHAGGVVTLASGLPYNLVTGTNNSGNTGGTTDRPVINGTVVSRNAGRGRAIYSVDPFLSRRMSLFGERAALELRAEAYNLLNHANFIGYNGTYGNGSTPPSSLGVPLPGVNSQLPARQMQFIARFSF